MVGSRLNPNQAVASPGMNKKQAPPGPSLSQCVTAALMYMGTAVMLIFFNKAVLSHYKFPHVNVITLIQLVVCIAMLLPARLLGWISFFRPSSPHYKLRFVPWSIIRMLVPLSVVYMLYMVLGMLAMVNVNLPMFTTLRRTTAVFTLITEWLLDGKHHSSGVIGSVAFICVGAAVAGLRDLDFDLWGYTMVIANNLLTALYLVVVAKYDRLSGLSSFGMMWTNSIISVPVLALVCYGTGEMHAAASFPLKSDVGFNIVMASSCFMAFALNYAIFWNTSINSALTQTICGNLKDVVVIAGGYFAFGGVAFDFLNFVGMAMGLIGSGAYAWIKLEERRAAQG